MQIHYLTYCLAPVVSTAVSKTVGSLWGPVGVTDSSISVSITLANGVGKGTVAIVVDAELGESGAGLTDESTGTKTEGLGISITLVEALRGPLGIGGSESWVDGDTRANQGSIAVTIVSFGITLAIGSLGGSVAVRGTSWVKAGASQSTEWCISITKGISGALSYGVGKGADSIVMKAEDRKTGAGLTDVSTCISVAVGISIS